MEVASVQAVCVGAFGRLVGAEGLQGIWGAVPLSERGSRWGGQPGACGAALLTPLAPYVPPKMGLCPGTPYRDLAARPEHLDGAQGHPREVEEDLNQGPQQPIQPGRIPAAPESSHSSPAFCIQRLSYLLFT